MSTWYVRTVNSEPVGPVSTDQVLRGLRAGKVPSNASLCRVGDTDWRPLADFPRFALALEEQADPRRRRPLPETNVKPAAPPVVGPGAPRVPARGAGPAGEGRPSTPPVRVSSPPAGPPPAPVHALRPSTPPAGASRPPPPGVAPSMRPSDWPRVPSKRDTGRPLHWIWIAAPSAGVMAVVGVVFITVMWARAPRQSPPPAATVPTASTPLTASRAGRPARSPDNGPPLAVVPPTRIPAGKAPGGEYWLPAFEVRRADGDRNATYLEALERCTDESGALCTEVQWQRACHVEHQLARIPTWTLTPADQGFVVRGGESGCAARTVAAGSERRPGRAAVCCSRAVAVRTNSPKPAFLMATTGKLGRYERAVSTRDWNTVGGLVGLLVVRGDRRSSSTEFLGELRGSAQEHPDQWMVFDRCDVELDASGHAWAASCRTIQQRGGQIAWVVQEYVWGGTGGRIQRFTEGEVLRGFAAP